MYITWNAQELKRFSYINDFSIYLAITKNLFYMPTSLALYQYGMDFPKSVKQSNKFEQSSLKMSLSRLDGRQKGFIQVFSRFFHNCARNLPKPRLFVHTSYNTQSVNQSVICIYIALYLLNDAIQKKKNKS